MRALEIIHVRLAARNPEALAGSVWAAVGAESANVDINVYRHAEVETDLLVQIRREHSDGSTSLSELGLRVAALLRLQGVIEHSVWVEQSGFTGTHPGLP